jgi:hypothetical protein
VRDRLQLDPDPTLIDELFDADDELPLERLLSACADQDVELAVLTDEALLLCGHDPDADPDPFWQPWLSRDGVDGEVARSTALRFFLTRGFVELETSPAVAGDEAGFRLLQPLRTLQWALAATRGLVTYRWEATDERAPEVGGAFVLPHELVLHDHQDPTQGLHRLVFRNLQVEVAWVAAMLDPLGCATSGDEPVVARTIEELQPRIDAIPGEHRTRSVVAATGRIDGVDAEQALTTFGTTAGLWASQARGGPEPVATLQRLGEEEVADAAGTLLRLAAG